MKKWTYLVVAGLLAGATPMLQSCVDNDEPEGINVLRKAKAELIAAKKVVQEAEAARLKAEAAKLEADAELVKAQATIAKAQAELINAQTEAERARLEQEISAAKAQLEHKQKMWEIAEKEAEVAYQKVLAELARTKAQVNKEQQEALSYYISMVDTRKSQYDAALKVVSEKQYALLQATEQVEQNEAEKDLLTRGYAKDVKDAQKALDRAKAELAIWEKEYELAKSLMPEEFTNRLDELNQQLIEMLAEQEKRCAALNEKKAELAPEYAELEELEAAADAAWNASVEVNEFKYTFPDWHLTSRGERTIVSQGSYILSDALSGQQTAYQDAKENLESWIMQIQWLARDENGRAWTAEDIAYLKSDVKWGNLIYGWFKRWWSDAVAAYRTGETWATLANLKPIEDEEDSYGYQDFVDAVKEFNTALAAYKTADQAYADFAAAHDEVAQRQAYQDQRDAAWGEYQAVLNENTETLEALAKEHDKAIDLLTKAYEVANAAYQEGLVKYNQLTNPTAADDTALENLRKAMENADKAITNENNAFYGYDKPDNTHVYGTIEIAQKKANDAADLAEAAYNLKIAQINEAERQNWFANFDEVAAEGGAALQARDDAFDVYMNAYFNADDIYRSLEERISIFNSGSELLDEGWINDEEVEISDELAVYEPKWAVESIVRDLSQMLYGSNLIITSLDDDRLVELTQADIDEILALYGYEEYEYFENYGYFGYFGSKLYYEARLAAMEYFMNMTEADYKAMIAAFQEQLDALNANLEAAVAAADAADLAAAEKEAEIEEALAPVQEAHDSLEDEIRVVYDLFIFYSTEVYWQHTLVGRIKEEVERQQGIVYEKETALMNAEKTLADWNNDAIDAVEAAQRALEVAQADADVAKENYDIALDRLQKALEFMAVSAE